MTRLLTLADECRRAGLEVLEVPGWQQRGADLGPVGAILAHHTATGSGTSDAAVDRLLRDGRPDLPGPLAQVGLNRRGCVRLIAAGRANHAGTGSWRGVTGNSRAVGVEAYNDGMGEPWPQAQLDAWDVLNTVLLRMCRLPADALCGHREWAPTRKTDPRGVDMPSMRARAHALLTTPEDDMALAPDEREWLKAVKDELTKLHPSAVPGSTYKSTLAGFVLGADAAAYSSEHQSRQALAEIAGLRAAVAALAGGDLTAEQVTEAARAGAAAALDAKIDSARVEISPRES